MTDRVLEWTLALPDIDVDQPTTEVRYFPIPLDLRRAVTAVFSISAKMAANTQTRPAEYGYVTEHYTGLNISLEDSLDETEWYEAGFAWISSLNSNKSVPICRIASPLGATARFSMQGFLKHRVSQNGQNTNYSRCDEKCEFRPIDRNGTIRNGKVQLLVRTL
jgi:hypothetical protein